MLSSLSPRTGGSVPPFHLLSSFFFFVVEIDHLQFLMIPVFSSLSLTKRAGRGEAKTQFSHCLVMLGVVYPLHC